MEAGDLLVEVLGQHVDAELVVVELGEQLDLREHLVGEGVAHHERRVTGRVAEVEQSPLRQHDDRVTVGERPLVDLRLDDHALHTGLVGEAGHVDLVVEVADVAQDRLVLHELHVLDVDDVVAAGGRDDDVGLGDHVVETGDLVPVHRCLKGVDGVDLGDDDTRALAAQRLGRTLAHVAVAADDGNLAADEDVGRAVDAVDERVAAAVLVVELALGDRVVDVDRREEQRARLVHLVETVDARRRLLGHALDACGDLGPARGALAQRAAKYVEDDGVLLGVTRVGRGDRTGELELTALVHEERGVATVVEDHVGTGTIGPAQHLLGAPPVLLERLALPGVDGDASRRLGGAGRTDRDGGGGVVLRREDVA